MITASQRIPTGSSVASNQQPSMISASNNAAAANLSDILLVVCVEKDNIVRLGPVPLGLSEGTFIQCLK